MHPGIFRTWTVSGFWQVKINEHKERTGFTVPSGHFEFNRLPFGLSNSPANFQRLMDLVLKDLIGDELHVFIENVIFSKTAEERAARLQHVLERFKRQTYSYTPEVYDRSNPGKLLRVCVVTRRNHRVTRQSESRSKLPYRGKRQGRKGICRTSFLL